MFRIAELLGLAYATFFVLSIYVIPGPLVEQSVKVATHGPQDITYLHGP